MNKQCIALYTLIRRELVRMIRIASQVFLPPVISTALYFLIFGSIIGHRIGSIQGISYPLFIAPGLILMAVITNAYSNVCTSLFSTRFQRSIEEMLVSPMHYGTLLLGYTFGGVLRGVIVATLVFLVSYYFADISLASLPWVLLIVVLVSAIFSLAGFANGMLARSFDDVAIVPTFVLTPLTYLGGVFYATDMLSPFWKTISYFNPILYMVTAMRDTMTGHASFHTSITISIIMAFLLILAGLNLVLLKMGTGLRD